MKTHLEFLEDTIAYYSEDPDNLRGVNMGSCAYRGTNDKGEVTKCAIGRYIPDKKYTPRHENAPISELICTECIPEIEHLNLTFLGLVQEFHDNKSCWSKKGLTKLGAKNAEKLRADALKLD